MDTHETQIPAKVVHVQDDQAAGPEESLLRVARNMAELDLPIRMRISIQLWDGVQYVSWRGQVWKVEVKTPEEAKEIQQALEGVFDLIAKVGGKQAILLLASLTPHQF